MATQNNYVVGKGSLFLQPFAAGTQTPTGGERFVGNCPSYKFTAKNTMLDHYSSTSGVKLRDDSTTLEAEYGGSFQCDNINPDNLAVAFLGSSSIFTDAGSTNNVESFPVANPDYTYQTGVTVARPAGAVNLANVTVRNQAAASGATVYVLGTDYTLDTANGRIYIIPGGAIATAGSFYAAYDVLASSRRQIITGNTPFEGAMRFMSNNPKGLQRNYFFPWVKVTPNGDYELIGDTYQVLTFDFEALTKTGLQTLYASGPAVGSGSPQ